MSSFLNSILLYLMISTLFNSIHCVDCDGGLSCDDNYTCCRNSSGRWGCCPYRDAVCCPSLNKCCRSGLHCSFTGCAGHTFLEKLLGFSGEQEIISF